ncbi:MAG TPA: hypothetical protein ENJ94_10095 [Gammaproteobacteria bacterium]|nr:hypothetical protein [Gammaproteobacteria bacterium]
MLPPKQSAASPDQRELMALYRRLDARGRASLLDYARFLASREASPEAPAAEVPAEPLGLARPAQETVIEAMRRLSRNYPMLEKDELLHRAAALMSSHVLQGRPASEVIDDLEALFAEAWERHAAACDPDAGGTECN